MKMANLQLPLPAVEPKPNPLLALALNIIAYRSYLKNIVSINTNRTSNYMQIHIQNIQDINDILYSSFIVANFKSMKT